MNVDNLSTSDFLEVRIATPNYVFSESTNNKNTNNLEQILQEETAWAEEANRQREAAQKAEEEASSWCNNIFNNSKYSLHSIVYKNS